VENQFIAFKVGQRWKTQMNRIFIIKEICEEEEYPLSCISMDSGRKCFFDEDGYAVAGYPTDNDLIEMLDHTDKSVERVY